MRKTNLLLTGLLLMGVPALAQPTFTQQDARTVFEQTFEADWEEWLSTPVDEITQIEYYNREGSGSFSGSNIYDGSWNWEIYGVRDTAITIYNAVVPTTFESDFDLLLRDSYSIVYDQSQERADAFAQFGQDGGEKVFRYISDDASGSTSYSNGAVPSYCRNLYVRGLDIEDNSSYRLTFYIKVNKLADIEPLLYADVMRGYYNSEKPFSMANSNNSFSFEKSDFTGDWEKITFMTYYTNDSIADGFFYRNGYWWGESSWTWDDGSGIVHNYIKQPDRYFFRLSFASDYTDFELDNLTLTKSTIGGVEYYGDKLRVDFGYQTNLSDLAWNAYDQNKIAAVEVPGEYFEVWGLRAGGNPGAADDWEEVPIRSAEYHGDGYMYMFTDFYEVGGKEYSFRFDYYDKVLVTFHNPVDLEDLCLRYSGTLYPNSLDQEWIDNGRPVLDFYNEVATLNPYIFDNVYSLKELPPVMQYAWYEDGSFGLDADTRELSFQFSREVNMDGLVATVGNEVWNAFWNEYTMSVVIARPDKYTSPLAGDYVVVLSNIQGIGTGYGEDVIMHYHFGTFDRNPQSNLVYKSDWRSEIIDETWDRPAPASVYIYNVEDGFYPGTGYSFSPYKKSGLFKMYDDGTNGDCILYITARNKGYYGNLYTVVNLEAGGYEISFPAFGWGTVNNTTTLYIYTKPADGMEYEYLSSATKSCIGSFKPSYQTSWSGNNDEHSWNSQTESFSFAFNVPVSGEYVLEWEVDNVGSQSYYGVVLGNISISTVGNLDLSYEYVTNLNKSIAAAQDVAAYAENQSFRYGGYELEYLESAISYYSNEFTSTAPSDWVNAKENVDYYTRAMQSRISDMDAFWNKMYNAEMTLETCYEYSGLYEYGILSELYDHYAEYDFSESSSWDVYESGNELTSAIQTLKERVDLNESFHAIRETGNMLMKMAEYPDYEEFDIMCSILREYYAYDDITASYDELENVYSIVKDAVYAYQYKNEGVEAMTRRVKQLAYLAQYTFGVEFPEDLNIYENAYNAQEDDDALANVLKAAIKVALYEQLAAGYDYEGLDLSPFIKNATLYATPKIVERTDYKANSSSVTNPDPDGANIQHVQHQWNSGDLNGQMPIWVIIPENNFDDLYPGWTVRATATGNWMVTPDDDSYSRLREGVPLFDGQLAMDWNGQAEIYSTIDGLPAGIYTIGVGLEQHSATSSNPSYITAYNENVNKTNSLSGSGSILYVDSIDVYYGTLGVDLVLRSGSGWSMADNFFLSYTPYRWGEYDYGEALEEAITELQNAITGYDPTYVPIDPSDPLYKAKKYLREAVSNAIAQLEEAEEYIYRGQDYDRLASLLEIAGRYESDSEFGYFGLGDSLYVYCSHLNNRIYIVDDYYSYLYSADYLLSYYSDYSYLAEFANLAEICNTYAEFDCPQMESAVLEEMTEDIRDAMDNLIVRIDIAMNGIHSMYFGGDLVGEAGDEFVIPVVLESTTPITAFSFDVSLPSGMTLVNAELAAERSNGHELSYNESAYGYYYNKSISFACLSFNNDTLMGGDGPVVYLTVRLEDYMEGTYEIDLYNIEMTQSPTRKYNPRSYYGYVYVIPYAMPGDVNNDGDITITDAVGVIAFVIKSDVEGLNSRAADANMDGIIDVADAVWIVNRVIGRNYVAGRDAGSSISSEIVVDEIGAGARMSMPVRLDGMINEITALQFDVTLPEGVRVESVTTDKNHMAVSRMQENGKLRVVCLSLGNNTFAGNGETAVTLQFVAGEKFNGGSVILDNTKLVTPDGCIKNGEAVESVIRAGDETGIYGIGADGQSEMYDLQGRPINNANGIYIRDGKKLIDVK
ncbi:MAG: dockerin type I repeat-containing protein [Bacteroidaceae bacterium]|nr:dockerin type I repeat-containing protein [Bacteroidaceae bacterium]